jgi:pimeloyl-ACP methyl ester carboxylesterase
MKTRTHSFRNIALILLALISTSSRSDAQSTDSSRNVNHSKPTIVLVHGAWADGSSWNKVIPILQKQGYETIAVQNPLTSLEDDVASVKRILAEVPGDVILVGHSWGGVVITEMGNDPKVKSLVYVAAYAPDLGESIVSISKDSYEIRKFPMSPVTDTDRIVSDGFIRLKEATVLNYFAQDLPKSEARLIAAGQGRFHVSTIIAKVSHLAWKTKPSFYIVADLDKIIPPQTESYMAKRINAKTYHLSGSHVVMLSQPEKVAEVILTAAKVK